MECMVPSTKSDIFNQHFSEIKFSIFTNFNCLSVAVDIFFKHESTFTLKIENLFP